MNPTNIPASQPTIDPHNPLMKPDFPQLYFTGKRRRRPLPDDDKEVFTLAFEIVNRLVKEQGGS